MSRARAPQLLARVLGLAFAGLAATALAQAWPAKPIRVVVPGAVGTPGDLAARAFGPALAASLGQPLVVENRPGANGIIGVEAVVRAAPDGYTLLSTQGATISLNPWFYAKLPYEPLRDLAPVVNVGLIAAGLYGSAQVPAASLKDLMDAARGKPGDLVWATWGSGSFSDLYRAWAESQFGVTFREVSYKSPDQAAIAVMTGEAQVMLNTPAVMAPQVRAGKLRGLATIGQRRAPQLPDVPSFSELGLDLDFRGFVGVFAPAGTPREIVSRLNADMARQIADPEVARLLLERVSIEPRGGTPEEFAAFLKKDRETAGRLSKLANVKPQ